jgi:hypothetical protein
MSDPQYDAVLRRIRSRIIERRRTPAFRAAAVVVGVGACGALAALALSIRHLRPDVMSFRVDGAQARGDGLVEAPPRSRPTIRFSDGSEVDMSEGARVHVRAVDEHGARLTLDEGFAHAYVVHAPGARWIFDAGPFLIAVKGTAFGLSWDVSRSRLDVRLENGSVTVSGPVFDTPLALQAGQWLTVRARNVLIRDLSASEGELEGGRGASGSRDDALWSSSGAPLAAGAGDASTMESVPGALEGGRGASPSSIARSEPLPGLDFGSASHSGGGARTGGGSSRHWSAALADGKFGEIFDQAQDLGLDRAFATSAPDDLAALADAARYLRHYDAARGALLAERHRFPNSDQAHAAAFSLGRLAEAQREPRSALSWFETYLSEVSDGIYASEALGRKMLLVEQLEGREAARPLAEMYLRRYPIGTYADPARALTLR